MCIAKCFNLFALLGFLYEDNRDLNIFLSFFVIIELLKKKKNTCIYQNIYNNFLKY